MSFAPLIQLNRGGLPECLHLGSVAVVDARGQLVAHAGDPQALTFTRSTLKPLQALPFVAAGGVQHFGLGSAQVAMLCASHSGEAMHVQHVQGMLDTIGLTYRALRCGCHAPGFLSALNQAPPADLVVDERHNNCSGKHVGFLAYCVQHQLPLHDYLEPTHPLQQAIRQHVAQVVGLPPDDLKMGIDGCSAPNYAMPLSRLAYAYARLASASGDSALEASLALLFAAMTAHPELVSGTGRSDLALMQAGRGDWVSKVGADGVQVLGSQRRGQALAIKIIDGNQAALLACTVEVLDQLGWLDAAQRDALRPWRAQALVNARGLLVGERLPVFTLHWA